MEQQLWLPPLNSHPNFYTLISAKQPYVSRIYQYAEAEEDPLIATMISVKIEFYSKECSSKREILVGLSLTKTHIIPCSELSLESVVQGKITILNMINNMTLGLGLKNFFLRRKHLGEAASIMWENGNIGSVAEKIWYFLCSMSKRPCNKGLDHSHFNLRITKMVCVPGSQFRAWISWYTEKENADPSFERKYMDAIMRPRTIMELLEPLMNSAKPALESAIEALEVVTIDESTCMAAETDHCCLVCLEKLDLGSKACRLPCSHVFHQECAVNWFQKSYKCPLCRFELPKK